MSTRYDELDRPIIENNPDQTTNYTYDEGLNAIGQLSRYETNDTQTQKTYKESYTYDNNGNLQSESKDYGDKVYTQSYTYNPSGQKTSQTYPDGTKVNYQYQNTIPVSVTYQDKTIQITKYSPSMKIEEMLYPNNSLAKNTYDPSTNYRITGKQLSTSSQSGTTSPQPSPTGEGVVQDVKYDYDTLGNIVNLKETNILSQFNKNVGYSYDALNRLTGAKYRDQENYSYAYSPTGNILYNSML